MNVTEFTPPRLARPGSLPDQVRRAAYRVANEGEHVRVEMSRIPEAVRRLRSCGADKWMQASPVTFDDLGVEERLTVALVFNAISFCYWPDPWWDNDWYESKVRRGSWALLGAIRHCIDSDVPILSGRYLESLSVADLERLLGGRGRLSLLERRAAILREVGAALIRVFGNSFLTMVHAADGNTCRLAELVVATFPSFNDCSTWNGANVPFQKRAQLLAADCHHIIRENDGAGLVGFEDLTACADYMLPALLADSGVIGYSNELERMISQGLPLTAGGVHEVEVRAATIVACDLISEQWGVPPMVVNDVLWIMAGEAFSDSARHHRTWTEAY